jgi:hypothetical protein
VVFEKKLRKSILIFFDEILIYSKDLQSQLEHLTAEYLGHAFSGDGLATDPATVQRIANWTTPSKTTKPR